MWLNEIQCPRCGSTPFSKRSFKVVIVNTFRFFTRWGTSPT